MKIDLKAYIDVLRNSDPVKRGEFGGLTLILAMLDRINNSEKYRGAVKIEIPVFLISNLSKEDGDVFYSLIQKMYDKEEGKDSKDLV